jgi:predicted Ser/Thr protein kinase
MGCLTESTIDRFVRHELSAGDVASADRHMAECPDCRGLVADSARSLRDSAQLATTVVDPPLPASGDPSLDSKPEMLAAGATVGRYVVSKLIGSGGMGVVYLARDPTLNRSITLKLLRTDRHGDKSAQAALLREAQAMAQLAHPNVVTVYDAGTFRSQVFVAMEFVEGETLGQWLLRTRPSWREVLRAFLQAGSGLAAAHARGIVHRDFKPANVLVAADGRVRVTDFGLARAVHTESGERCDPSSGTSALTDWNIAMTLTETGAIKGTPAYMAPEQFRSRPSDARTDQFGFCVALYEALYGHRPFHSQSLVRDVLAGAVRPPPVASRVPRSLRTIVLRGLRVEPDERYASMEQLLKRLEEHLVRTRRTRALAVAALVGASVIIGLYVRAHRPAPIAHDTPIAASAPPEAMSVVNVAAPAPQPAAASVAVVLPPNNAAAPVTAGSKPSKAPSPAPRRITHRVKAPQPGYDDSMLEPSFGRNAP